jgi:hypothetical protein
VQRLFSQIARVLEINWPRTITKEAAAAAGATLLLERTLL